jgi:hypothetical protein
MTRASLTPTPTQAYLLGATTSSRSACIMAMYPHPCNSIVPFIHARVLQCRYVTQHNTVIC